MASNGWRLLAALSLILLLPRSLPGQDALRERAFTSGRKGGNPAYSPVTPGSVVRPPNFPRQTPSLPGSDTFKNIVGASGIIFSGRVTSVGRVALSSGQAPPSTTITFHVERALRGISPGQDLTIHEWAGLWASGERYHVGETVLLFLYRPSKVGLTSPVEGALGRFALDSQGRVLLSGIHSASFAADPILGGRTVVAYSDFALAVQRSRRE